MNSSSWRLEGVDGGDEQYPVEACFVVRHTPPDEQDPCFDRSTPTQVRLVRFAVRHTPPDQHDPRFDRRRSVSSVLRYATPLPIKRTLVSTVGGPFPPLCGTPCLVSIASSVQPLPMNMTTHSVPTHEHDDDVVSLFRPSHVHETSPYVCASRRSRPRPYVHIRGRIFFLGPWPPLLRHVRASTSTSIYVRTHSRPE